ncbi:beta-glucosidase [Halobaculum gomorrense]|uniref:Beta-glucosidase n=1 Tax=Halobaculum gomorrense TaxID=43928 RepID=A0A1M5K336_9EURY|nr:glycoside hydrolase family 3 C-terminal domain-containing protein [Halobaculum gomorrense]SHG47161.1 beta-glucosidase [Halobaculum gomorrense]
MNERARSVLKEATLDEAVSLCHGAVDPEGDATGYISGIERLGVSPTRFVDGSLGVRVPGQAATAFPAPLAVAATFDTEIAADVGAAMGREAAALGQDVLLAPGTNIVRVPHGGRNFEYYSEDPVHAGAFAAATVEGIQSAGVLACVKHYVANNQETERAAVNVDVDERTLREVYLPPFRAAVDADVAAVMSAYNAVGGTPMSEHRRLLREVLKGEWGFEGFVVSDWFGTGDAVRTANGGLDMEMPGVPLSTFATEMGAPEGGDEEEAFGDEADAGADDHGVSEESAGGEGAPPHGGLPDPRTVARFAETLAPAVRSGEVSRDRVDDMAGRVVSRLAAFDRLDGDRPAGAVDTPDHRALAERVAVRGTVLLENDGVLPLADAAAVALVGPNVDRALAGGGGSSSVEAAAESTPVEGLRDRAAGEVTVAPGHPLIADPSMMDAPDDGDGSVTATGGPPGAVDRADGSPDSTRTLAAAVDAAASADVAVVFVRDRATEAWDRPDLSLPGAQDDLVTAVADAAERTVVVINSAGAVETPWREAVDAVVENWYPGQAHGAATAAVLYGDCDPGGRLPVTVAPEEAYPKADPTRFPGEDGVVEYGEGRLVGYRHFDATDAEATYPFGHGHSYAAFEYRGATRVDERTVRVRVANTADRDGREVVQAYVRYARDADADGADASADDADAARFADEPRRVLAGFASVRVPAGQTVAVTVDLADLPFHRYDDGWTERSGPFVVEVGRSATDIRTAVRFERE